MASRDHPLAGRVPRLVVGAAEPRDPGPLRAGLDVQDGHRRRRARRRHLHARLDVLRPRLLHRVRQAGLRTPEPDQNGPEQFGNVDLVQAYQHSINAVFCNIGKKLGARRILDKAKEFGFYSKPPLELPANELAPSGLYNFKKHKLYRRARHCVDPGRLAFGQEHMLVTPLQMALVAAGDRERRHGDGAAPRQGGAEHRAGGIVVRCTHRSGSTR